MNMLKEMLALFRELALQLKKLKAQKRQSIKDIAEATKVLTDLKAMHDSYEKALVENEERINLLKDPTDVAVLKETLDKQKTTLAEYSVSLDETSSKLKHLQAEADEIAANREKTRDEQKKVRGSLIRMIQVETSVVSDRDVLIALAATAREVSFSQRRIISKIRRIDGLEPLSHRKRRRARWARTHKKEA